jgi:hypothetical protein
MKTRVRPREGGGCELKRLLSPQELNEWKKDDPLSYEKSIVWLEDIDALPFVRVRVVRTARSRRGPLHWSGEGRVVGYSKLTPDAPRDADSNAYVRRVFYLRSSDVASWEQVPAGAVDPRSVAPGCEGALPE